MGGSKERDVKKKARVGRERAGKNKGRLKWRNVGAGKASERRLDKGRDTKERVTESAVRGRGGKKIVKQENVSAARRWGWGGEVKGTGTK